MAKRNDIHRAGAIIPANYVYVLSYSLATSMGGYPVPSVNVNCEMDRRVWKNASGQIVPSFSSEAVTCENGKHAESGMCCLIGIAQSGAKFAEHGGAGKCTACGARFIYGDVWKHVATGEHLHLGHDCADKYEMIADRTDFDHENEAMRSGVAREIEKAEREEERREFLAQHAGLEEALKTDLPIIKDIAERFRMFRNLSDKQVALVMKLANEAKNPTEKFVTAPTGRLTFTGEIVSAKNHESDYGIITRVTIKIATPDGAWMAWGTCPAALYREVNGNLDALKGRTVELTATLAPGREAHFAKMSRPVGKLQG